MTEETQVTEATEAPQPTEAVEQSQYDALQEAAKLISFDEQPDDAQEADPVDSESDSEEESDTPDEVEAKEDTPDADEPKPEEELSAPKRAKALAEMIRREKKLLKKNKELAKNKGLSEKERAELQRIKDDPISYLEEKNPEFYSEYTKRKLNNDKPTPDEAIRQLRDEIKELRENNENLRKLTAEEKQAHVINNARLEIKELLQADEYELTRLAGNGDDEILNLIGMHWQQTGEDLTIKEAAAMIESELESRVERLSQAKKFKSRLGGKSKGTTAKKEPSAGTRTLSNTMTSSSAPLDLSEMSDYEALQMLAKTIEWPTD